jgi:hypothetical protein
VVEAPIDAEGIEEIIGVPMLTADPSEVLEARCALDILVLIRGSVPLRAKRVYEGLSYNDTGEVKSVVGYAGATSWFHFHAPRVGKS